MSEMPDLSQELPGLEADGHNFDAPRYYLKPRTKPSVF